MSTATATTEHLANEIRAELARQRLSQADLGALIGETQGWVSRRLGPNGAETIKVDDAVRMCVALKMNMVKVFADAPPEPEPVVDISDRRRRYERRTQQIPPSRWSDAAAIRKWSDAAAIRIIRCSGHTESAPSLAA